MNNIIVTIFSLSKFLLYIITIIAHFLDPMYIDYITLLSYLLSLGRHTVRGIMAAHFLRFLRTSFLNFYSFNLTLCLPYYTRLYSLTTSTDCFLLTTAYHSFPRPKGLRYSLISCGKPASNQSARPRISVHCISPVEILSFCYLA